ncbi:MAG: ABC transporter permease subunit [Gammaproteobacteria bacterium]|nr:ABC transporter permease subunit [Gammaproteobacteria bacterium]
MPTENTSLLEHRKEALARRRKWRTFIDITANYGVGFGGVSVIIAIVLIFFYLLYVVLPLFANASIQVMGEYSAPGGSDYSSELIALEEQNEIGVRFTHGGHAIFFNAGTGNIIEDVTLAIPPGTAITSFTQGNPVTRLVAYGLSNGRVIVARHQYQLSYPSDQRVITPRIEYPFGEEALLIDEKGRAISQLELRATGEALSVVALLEDAEVLIAHYDRQESLLEEEVSLQRTVFTVDHGMDFVEYLLLDKEQRNLYLADRSGAVRHYDLSDRESAVLLGTTSVIEQGAQISCFAFLGGELSLLVGDTRGRISQWFTSQDALGNKKLVRVRQFQLDNYPIIAIAREERRKGFVAADDKGNVGIFHSTAERRLLVEQTPQPVKFLGLSPRANALLIEDKAGSYRFWKIHNEHPEISWSSLWGKVWYESYGESRYIWQSSSASNDFEPKLSLTPLVFGTFKGAFYAMLFAVPLAIMGAIYTAYFMAPRMRRMVKPSIETMEALPTVILGFLAGLWLAPFVEDHLPGIFSLLLVLPVGVLIAAYCWHALPGRIKHRIPDGWTAALLVPVVLLISWISLSLSQPLELWLFDGNMRSWLTNEMGVSFDQRNALVVGFAMGFAVIPNIFSIAEDAIFSVPKHLTIGSLALGATPWQTMMRVVLLTASPGIFSAIMIGLGRAVGETMIVLMATGNTPVMDMSIFQGMRTLAANTAVEMPESEVDSTHYRVLFLAALVLFMMTFLFNTLAELIRQRLRVKYSSL